MKVLVTGAAGFIGSHVSQQLLDKGIQVVGLDNLNDYYSVQLKKDRLVSLLEHAAFEFVKIDVEDTSELSQLFEKHRFDKVIHLAAQAGVRYSLDNPMAYINSNVVGFTNILESCRHNKIKHLVYASSSSVYGANTKLPFSTKDNVDHPISLYAATKKSNELMAHVYSHLFELPTTGLRFFTVYGPWGRPDMALFKFVDAIYNDKSISVFNQGDMIRDFTYVDDIANGVVSVLDIPPEANPNILESERSADKSHAPYRLYNIGNNDPVSLMTFIKAIEKACGKKAKIEYLPMQPGDVPATHADVSPLAKEFNYHPKTTVDQGIENFVTWYQKYYKVS
tara:strand:- start:190610 stop:191620 length:1011 start_codon:yes stop_codon:yes gene_type:complete